MTIGVLVVLVVVGVAAGILITRRPASRQDNDLTSSLGLSTQHETDTTTGIDPHQTAARAEAKKLLLAFIPPRGATRSGDDTVLASPPMPPSTPDFIDLHRNWTEPVTAKALATHLQANPPKGLRVIGWGSSKGGTSSTFQITLAPNGTKPHDFDAVLASGVDGSLQLSVVDLGHGVAALRADAVTTWTRTRTRADQVPSEPVRLTISHTPDMNLGTTVGRVTVADQQTITRIAALLDRLEPIFGGTVMCPMDNGEHFALRFWSTETSKPSATATVDVSGCRMVTVTIGALKPHVYQGNDELSTLLAHLDP